MPILMFVYGQGEQKAQLSASEEKDTECPQVGTVYGMTDYNSKEVWGVISKAFIINSEWFEESQEKEIMSWMKGLGQ